MKNLHRLLEMEYEEVQVECHSGYKVNEYPVAFILQGQRRSVSEIVDRWYEGGTTPDKPVIDYFKVKTDEGSICILMYAAHQDQWFIRG